MGLTSYYPIDRSSIVNMPQIVEPEPSKLYEDYSISKNINIVECYMSSFQWNQYETEYSKEKLKSLQKIQRRNMFNDDTFEYHIRTRQNWNIVYEDDTFRKKNYDNKKEDDVNVNLKQKTYDQMKSKGHFSVDQTLSIVSPKFYEIMKNIEKNKLSFTFIDLHKVDCL